MENEKENETILFGSAKRNSAKKYAVWRRNIRRRETRCAIEATSPEKKSIRQKRRGRVRVHALRRRRALLEKKSIQNAAFRAFMNDVSSDLLCTAMDGEDVSDWTVIFPLWNWANPERKENQQAVGSSLEIGAWLPSNFRNSKYNLPATLPAAFTAHISLKPVSQSNRCNNKTFSIKEPSRPHQLQFSYSESLPTSLWHFIKRLEL